MICHARDLKALYRHFYAEFNKAAEQGRAKAFALARYGEMYSTGDHVAFFSILAFHVSCSQARLNPIHRQELTVVKVVGLAILP